MNDLECLKINYDVDGWKTISEREGNHCIVPLGAVYAIRSLIEEVEQLRAKNADKLRQAKGDGMNPKDFFSKYGREQIEIGCPWVTVEEMYQAFKARMMEELCHTSGQACKTPTTNNPKSGI